VNVIRNFHFSFTYKTNDRFLISAFPELVSLMNKILIEPNSSSDAALIAPLPPTSFLFLYALFHRLKGSLQHMVFCHTDIDLKSDLSACMKSEEAGLRNLGDGTLDEARSIDRV